MAFCPECQAEYVAGIETCAECKVPLVESLPPEEDYVTVYAATDVLEAGLVKETLEAEGIVAMVMSHEDRAFPAHGAQSGYQVDVADSQADAARQLIAEAVSQGLFGGAGEKIDGEGEEGGEEDGEGEDAAPQPEEK